MYKMDLLTANGMNGNQYLRPEYLSPLPTTLDAKKSPLALLAQTCSQIGADPPSTKSLLSSLTASARADQSAASSENERSASSSSSSASTTTNNNSNQNNNNKKSKSKSKHQNLNNDLVKEKDLKIKCESEIKEKNTTTCEEQIKCRPKTVSPVPLKDPSPREKSKSPPINTKPSTPPHQRSLNSEQRRSPPSKDKLNLIGPDLSPLPSLSQQKPLPFYPSLPPSSTSAIPPYLHSYARLKAAAGDHHLLPTSSLPSSQCRDPFCGGCQLGAAGHLSSLAGKCPAGCVSCDHPKVNSFNNFLFPPGFPPLPPSLASFYNQNQPTSQPYVCNWISSDTYCGKRFQSSDDLLQHLRSHTNLNTTEGAGTLQSVMDRYHPLLSSRTYPTPPLSPLSSARFHPYSKPNSSFLPPPFAPPFSALAAAAAAAAANPLNPYYPYSLYGQRLGAGANPLGHP